MPDPTPTEARERPDRGRALGLDALFPPVGHRYYTTDRIEQLRQRALGGCDVTLDALDVLELVCDWRNMTAELEELGFPDCLTDPEEAP